MNFAIIETIIPSGFIGTGVLMGLIAFYLIIRYRDKKMKDYTGV